MTTSYKPHASSVVPAQLSFLAIYNPTLGPTDETFADQLVFWYSRKATEARRAENRSDAGADARRKAADREEENERLRQIGLAQGMIGFAKTFSDGEKPVDSIETDKSRIVVHELEVGWWILASVDLTRLPAPANVAGSKNKSDPGAKPKVEYSSREVSPPALLTQQLMQAHWVFLLHHGPSLDEMFVKQSRDKFCGTLERYWMRFARSWDVLLHGNPAVDVFGGIKLAAGGELGVGVGEEEWGSGEREVLEDLTRRTEGLVDVVVARYGEPMAKEENSVSETEALPWMGTGSVPAAADGIIFGGIDKLNRPSVRSISLWMQQIYAYGDYAYGVKDNPGRERRKRRRRNPAFDTNAAPSPPRQSPSADAKDMPQKVQQQEDSPVIDPGLLPKDDRPQLHDRVASYDHATGTMTPSSAGHPDIPPPIVSAAEQALTKATRGADKKSAQESTNETDGNTTMGIPDQYMKYMTFGLSSLAKSYNKKQPETTQPPSINSKKSKPPDNTNTRKTKPTQQRSIPTPSETPLSHTDPIPEGEELRAKTSQQIHAENTGHFVVGLKGNLTTTPPSSTTSQDDDETMTEGSFHSQSGGSRTLLRTLQVELLPKQQTYSDRVNEDLERGDGADNSTGHLAPNNPATKDHRRLRVLIYVRRPFIFAFLFEQRTSSLSYPSLYKSLHATLTPIYTRLLASTSPETVAHRLAIHHSEHHQLPPSSTSDNSNENPIFSLLHDPSTLSLHSTIPNIPPPGAYKPWPRLDALNVHAALLASLATTTTTTSSSINPAADAELERSSKTARGWWVVWLRLAPSVASEEARPREDDEGGGSGSGSGSQVGGGGEVRSEGEGEEAESGARGLDSQGGALSTVGVGPSFAAKKASVGETHRVAFLVRKAGESSAAGAAAKGGGGVGSGGSGRLGSGMWSSFGGFRGVGGGFGVGGGGGGGGGEDSGTAAAASSAGMGGFGVDARRYVEGLLSLNR